MKSPTRRRIFLMGALLVGMALGGSREAMAQSDCEKLKSDYEALKVNYDNAVAQAKALLIYKTQARDADTVSQRFELERQRLISDKEGLNKRVIELEEKIQYLESQVARTSLEKEDYKKSFEKASVENIIGVETKKKIADLEKEKGDFAAKVSETEKHVKALEAEGLRKEAQAELMKRQIAEMRTKYDEARKKNRALEQKIDETPRKFAELARENKILVKRTALMHYNLGVFYTQNRDFNRAIPEFEKAIELNPDDSASYFNLGYIYAEHLQNRSKAIEVFRKFLKLVKKDDKDADWVKRYILTWQTWEGKEPIN